MGAIIGRYKKQNDSSYVLGIFPCLELLTKKPKVVKQVVLASETDQGNGVAKIQQICKERNILVTVNSKLFKKLSPKENIYAVAEFYKYKTEISSNSNKVVLINPSNAGNLGTVIRTMSGFNIKDLIIVNPAVDIFQPEVIRSSMGSIFDINFLYFDSVEDYLRTESNNAYIFCTDAEKQLANIKYKLPFSLIFGGEGPGIPKNIDIVGEKIKIPMQGNIDSYNLAVSVGIALYRSVI